VGNELVAGAAQLVGVPVAGEIEGAPDRAAIDCLDRDGKIAASPVRLGAGDGIELLDDGEEIG
jgi:hypothetical protein